MTTAIGADTRGRKTRSLVVICAASLGCASCTGSSTVESNPVAAYINQESKAVELSPQESVNITEPGTYVAYGRAIVVDTTEPITLIVNNAEIDSITGSGDITLSVTGRSMVQTLETGGIVTIGGPGSLLVTRTLNAEQAVVNSGELLTDATTEVLCEVLTTQGHYSAA
ncbi:hypothetical protein NQ024_05900 [Corynebacterium sp. 35RC1]|nr:hypothetical protein [Corynebacterium sp. 35RC1]